MITRKQVADLRPGDVVKYRSYRWPEDHEVTGALYIRGSDGALCLADDAVRLSDGDVTAGNYHQGTLTVISRAPRPLYVNHDRTEPVPGDIARDVDGDAWRRGRDGWYLTGCDGCLDEVKRSYHPLTLIWDGETEQVVP